MQPGSIISKIPLSKTFIFGVALTATFLFPHQSRSQSAPGNAAWPHKLVKKWSVPTAQTDAAPALAGDRIYTFGRDVDGFVEGVHCLNLEDGKALWAEGYHSGAGAEGFVPPEHSGGRSSPVLADGKIFTVGLLGTVSCVDAEKGKPLWRQNLKEAYPKAFGFQTPLVLGGVCIAHATGSDDQVVVGYDTASGAAEKWRFNADNPSYSGLVGITIGTPFAFIQTDQSIIAVNATNGKLVWQSTFTSPPTNGFVPAPVASDGDTIIYSDQSRAYAVRFELAGTNFHISSRELWTNPNLSWQFHRPLIRNAQLFALTGQGRFICVNARTGKTLWQEPAGGHPPYGSIIDGGSVLFALTPDGQMTVLAADEPTFTPLAKIKVSDKPTFAAPILSGNQLLIQDQGALTLWTIE